MECEIKFANLKFCGADVKFFMFQKNFLHNKEKKLSTVLFSKSIVFDFCMRDNNSRSQYTV